MSFTIRTTDCEAGGTERPGVPSSMGWINDGLSDLWRVNCPVCGLSVGIEMLGGTANQDGTVTYHSTGATTDASYRLRPHERVLSNAELNDILDKLGASYRANDRAELMSVLLDLEGQLRLHYGSCDCLVTGRRCQGAIRLRLQANTLEVEVFEGLREVALPHMEGA